MCIGVVIVGEAGNWAEGHPQAGAGKGPVIVGDVWKVVVVVNHEGKAVQYRCAWVVDHAAHTAAQYLCGLAMGEQSPVKVVH